jgi:tetratricopeptide (TPR) repeat protein
MKTTLIVSALALLCTAAFAKRAMTLQEAIADAEAALDTGRVGDAITTAERLQKSRGLTKEEVGRVEVIVARCRLIEGRFDQSEKILAKHVKAAPDNSRLAEWYARALDGNGKSEQAMTLLKDLAKKDALAEGDSYWTLAKLEHKKGELKAANTHARLALQKPIVLQSDELDQAIRQLIDETKAAK